MSIKSTLTKTAALAVLSIAVIGGSGLASSQAEAGHKHKKFGKFGVGIMIGAPAVYGGYGYHRHHGYRRCGWLLRRAEATGSRYWWKRFQQCRYGW